MTRARSSTRHRDSEIAAVAVFDGSLSETARSVTFADFMDSPCRETKTVTGRDEPAGTAASAFCSRAALLRSGL